MQHRSEWEMTFLWMQ